MSIKTDQQSQAIAQFRGLAQHWAVLTDPPFRPSKEEISIYDKWLGRLAGHNPSKTLVFGSTPELRDLGLKRKAYVTAVDISPAMMQAMTFLMKEDQGREELLNANWLEVPREDSSYDIAMGDNYLNMVHRSQVVPLIEETWRLLKPGGHLITAFMMLVPAEKRKPAEELVSDYESGRLAAGDLIYFGGADFWNPTTKMLDSEDFFALVDRLYDSGKASQQTIKALAPYRPPDSLQMNMTTEDEFEALVSPNFEILAKEYGADFQVCCCRPIYVLRSRKGAGA